jgi:CubicO group peptidase (beta-lactamase class C family)
MSSISFRSWPCFSDYEPESSWLPNDGQAGQPRSEGGRKVRRNLHICLVALVLLLACGGQTAASPTQQELPLRFAEPVEAIVADLESFVPQYMREEHVPGLTIALIHDGRVAWAEGFGVANTITGRPVTPGMAFEVASNSKVVTAYIALRLVDQGRLSLDEPLNNYLTEPWLPASEYRDAITLRHVLSHTSGLGHNTTSRESLFAPDRGYSYSAIGFLYLQAVIEQVTGQSLEDVAQEMVFGPLGMSSSSFVVGAEREAHTVNGHVHAVVPVLVFAVLYAVSTVIVGLPGLLVLRIRTGRWRPTRRMAIGVFAVALVVSLVPAFILLGSAGLPEFGWLVVLVGLASAVAFALAFLAGRVIVRRLSPQRGRLQVAAMVAWSGLILVGLALGASRITNLPVPQPSRVEAGAAGSVCASAGDMAAFLIELSDPQHLSPEMAAQLRASQVKLASDMSWGLGPGIQHSQQGDALWQWGQHLHFQSVMIIYPDHGFGVVVCTNNDLLNPDVAIEIAGRALGGKIEPIRRASHLQFNYHEESQSRG